MIFKWDILSGPRGIKSHWVNPSQNFDNENRDNLEAFLGSATRCTLYSDPPSIVKTIFDPSNGVKTFVRTPGVIRRYC